MSASGIGPTDEALAAYQEIKTKRTCRYVEFQIEGTSIVPGKKGDRDSTWSDFTAQFPKDACRYYLFDYPFVTPDGAQKDKLVFVFWAPDTCKVKEKMLAASSKEAFRAKMEGVVEFQCNDMSDAAESELKSKLR
eukprot:NODE_519_length_765_cov_412.993730_g510_i0.p1 GENE.NODE_519_length_765_cov_412.993730_g510_i0~~NODE_519_length_765_cov_412.993730_g510_i0.p1  ORF type:complete len:156 (+),score=33.34 NODE_519_length_765_cov_412.993730_g510_i0:66-470(+)